MARVKRRLKNKVSLIPIAVMTAILVSIAVPAYKLYTKLNMDIEKSAGDSDTDNLNDNVDRLPLFRDLFAQEEWVGVEWNCSEPSPSYHTVHYLWCGQKVFRFQDYLSILSVIRVIQPLKLVFHYTHLPQLDNLWYHTWFQELKQSVPNLVLTPFTTDHPCDSVDVLKAALRLLSAHGGLLVGQGVVLTKAIDRLKLLPFWFAFSDPLRHPVSGVVFVNRGFNEYTLDHYLLTIKANAATCVTKDDYDRLEYIGENESLCVNLTEDLYPRDIRSSDSPFADLARWLFYGRKRPFFTVHSEENMIPRISHSTWMSSDDPEDDDQFAFVHYLSIMSALYVAELDHVYIHGDVKPQGVWWEELKNENVTFIRVDHPDTVFQQPIGIAAHASNVVRYYVLFKYGGVYQDVDVLWTSRLPDWLRGYPAVAGPEWPRYGERPYALNLGVLLARRHASFLRHVLSTYRYFRDEDWNFNAVLMPYRVYEWFPDSLYLDIYLQAICSHGVCHPAWSDDYDNSAPATTVDDNDYHSQAPASVSLQEVRAVHLRVPKIPGSLASPAALSSGSDVFADVGRFVLEQSGRMDLLSKELDEDRVGAER